MYAHGSNAPSRARFSACFSRLRSTIPGLFVLGEANFSDHGANRLGASASMQGLSDGYFILPYTVGDYIANSKLEKIDATHPEFQRAQTESRSSPNVCCP